MNSGGKSERVNTLINYVKSYDLTKHHRLQLRSITRLPSIFLRMA